MPARPWNAWPLERLLRAGIPSQAREYRDYRKQNKPAFFFSSNDRARYQPILASFDTLTTNVSPDWPQQRLAEINSGNIRFFRQHLWDTGWPPDWHKNALDGRRSPRDLHFSQIGDFSTGDIKILWELNRFSFAFDLVRIYWRSGDENAPRLFWEAFEDWYQNNPPNLGVNWKCGQEITFRLMAWSFGLWGFQDSRETTPERITKLVQAVGVSAHRIEANIAYALSQKNNHAVSEAVGLWTIGLLFPELISSDRWRASGEKHLEHLAKQLVFDDGGFSQYSANYHRLMLHDFLWAIRLGEIHGHPLSTALKERVHRAVALLQAIIDESSGGVPRYGADDGSLILPLDECDYWDFRPVVQLGSWILGNQKPFPLGPWDEDLLWLGGLDASRSQPTGIQFGDSQAEFAGIHILRGKTSHAVLRSGRYRFRPSDLDLLHVDLWWRGINVAVDPGTYSYHAEGYWCDNPLRATRYHNTVLMNQVDQSQLVNRFLALPWPESRIVAYRRSPDGQLALLEAEFESPITANPGARHRRIVIQVLDDNWLILDHVGLPTPGVARLHWLLQDAPYELNMACRRLELSLHPGIYHLHWGVLEGEPLGTELVRGDKSSPRGWRSPGYWNKEPALSMSFDARGSSIWFYSWFSQHVSNITTEHPMVTIPYGDSILRCTLVSSQHGLSMTTIDKITLSGSDTSELAL